MGLTAEAGKKAESMEMGTGFMLLMKMFTMFGTQIMKGKEKKPTGPMTTTQTSTQMIST